MFEFDDKFSYRMPAHFGGYEGCPQPSFCDDISVLQACYTTDRHQLESLVPADFELLEPKVFVTYTLSRGVDGLGGQDSNSIAVEVPVRFEGKKDTPLQGFFVLCVWEDRITTILSGRDGGGIPKLGAHVSTIKKDQNGRSTSARFAGKTFLSVEFSEAQPASQQQTDDINRQNRRVNWFGWRYIPRLGEPGADLSTPTLFPKEYKFQSILLGTAKVRWTPLTIEENPTQAHVILALAQLPAHQFLEASLSQGLSVMRYDEARALS
ncbi:MAG: acetoacetate decarboxylase family protein [Pseudomonadota bacterium]